MTAELDIAALTKAMTDAMVKHFTTEELRRWQIFMARLWENLPCKNLVLTWPTSCR
jgi:hypothetical protein